MEPIGRLTSSAGRRIARAFDAALEQAGGSLAIWLVLLALKQQPGRTQRDLAAAVGVRSPTMTRHLDNMEAAGLVARRRDPADRRVMLVTLTPGGEQAFDRLRTAAAAFDRQLRAGLSEEDLSQLRHLLGRLLRNLPD